MDAAPPLVALQGVTKRFGDFAAVSHVDIDIRRGETHALLGENGAGKSTLVKMLYGLLQPSEGRILWDGAPVRLHSPQQARARGVGMVFQHFSLFEDLTVAENIALVSPEIPQGRLVQAIADTSARYGLALQPDRPVWSLSAGERQRVEIARCLLQNPSLLILDEPTSVLTPQEAERLFETLESLRGEDRAILYISHRLEEVRRLCDRATILRRGKVVATADPSAHSARELAAMMVGSEIAEVKTATPRADAPTRLSVNHLHHRPAELHAVALRDVCLDVRAGEILGVAGVAGEGQSELFEVLSGEVAVENAAIKIDGGDCGAASVSERRRRGAAFVPEERLGHSAAPDLSLAENIVLTGWATQGLIRAGLVAMDRARVAADRVIAAFDVRAGGVDAEARTLSGGNLQKFVVGREILREPGVLVVNQPTWGVDARAAGAIRQALLDLAARGAAVLAISQDLDELFEIADRIAVIHKGALSAPLETARATREEIGLLMGGAGAQMDSAHAS